MSTELFRRIAKKLASHDRFFQQRRNAAGELGHSTFQKVTAALRMLAYGIPADLVDDQLAMGESQAIICVKRFAVEIVQVFGQKIFEISQCRRSHKAIGDEQSLQLPMYAWLDRLHALELE